MEQLGSSQSPVRPEGKWSVGVGVSPSSHCAHWSFSPLLCSRVKLVPKAVVVVKAHRAPVVSPVPPAPLAPPALL